MTTSINKVKSYTFNMKTILVLDDMKKWHGLIKRYISLDQHNYIVTSTFSPEEAYAKFTESKPNIIISDINLNPKIPESIEGLENFVKKVRIQNKNIPIVCMSANPNLESLALQYGANTFVWKKELHNNLMETIGQYI